MSRDLTQSIFVVGHRGMVGSAILRRLESLGYSNILTASREELNLIDQAAVQKFFQSNRIDQVYLAAAKVGGFMPTIFFQPTLFTRIWLSKLM